MNISLVASVLRIRADLTSASDTDAATALNVPIRTPRSQRVTLATLADSNCWGFAKTIAFQGALTAVQAAGGSNGATAASLLSLLAGPGFATTDPQIAALLPSIVALSQGTITTDDAYNAIATTSYACGTGDVTAANVTLARQVIAFQDAQASLLNEKVAVGIQAISTALDMQLQQLLVGQNVTILTPAQIASTFATAVEA